MLEAYYAFAIAADPTWAPAPTQMQVEWSLPLGHRLRPASELPRLSDVVIPADAPAFEAEWHDIEALVYIFGGAKIGRKDVQASFILGEHDHSWRALTQAMSRLRRVQACALGRPGATGLFTLAAQHVLKGGRHVPARMQLAMQLLKFEHAADRHAFFAPAARGLALPVGPSAVSPDGLRTLASDWTEPAGGEASGESTRRSQPIGGVEPAKAPSGPRSGASSLGTGGQLSATLATPLVDYPSPPNSPPSPALICNGGEVHDRLNPV